jgi:hypothetical protein
MDDLTSCFLDAYAAIESWLRGQAASAARLDFPALVDAVAD